LCVLNEFLCFERTILFGNALAYILVKSYSLLCLSSLLPRPQPGFIFVFLVHSFELLQDNELSSFLSTAQTREPSSFYSPAFAHSSNTSPCHFFLYDNFIMSLLSLCCYSSCFEYVFCLCVYLLHYSVFSERETMHYSFSPQHSCSV
jgi:hypothetical protein